MDNARALPTTPQGHQQQRSIDVLLRSVNLTCYRQRRRATGPRRTDSPNPSETKSAIGCTPISTESKAMRRTQDTGTAGPANPVPRRPSNRSGKKSFRLCSSRMIDITFSTPPRRWPRTLYCPFYLFHPRGIPTDSECLRIALAYPYDSLSAALRRPPKPSRRPRRWVDRGTALRSVAASNREPATTFIC